MNILSERISRLKSVCKKGQLDAYVIENPLDLFYYTGLKLSAGRLLIHEKDALLLVDGRYLQMAQEKFPFATVLDSNEAWLAFWTTHPVRSLGFDGKHTSYEHFLRLDALAKKAQHPIELISASSVPQAVRAVKEQEEIAKMQKSASLLWKGFEEICLSLKLGVTEKELARRFEIFCLERGAEGLSFEPIIAFGPNGAMPHYRSGDTRLQEGDSVLIDIGIVLDNYHSDMTRVVFFKKENQEIKHLYEIVKEAQQSALKLCRPGTLCKELDRAARQVMKEKNVEGLFLHSLGHGIGLETHEFPRIKHNGDDQNVVLQSGMVFTIEPGLYIPGKGGVRYEDTVVITPTGYINFYPTEEIEVIR